MATFRVTYLRVPVEVTIMVEAADEDQAMDMAHTQAEEWAQTVVGDNQGLTADLSLDGIGCDTVEEISAAEPQGDAPEWTL